MLFGLRPHSFLLSALLPSVLLTPNLPREIVNSSTSIAAAAALIRHFSQNPWELPPAIIASNHRQNGHR